MSPKTIKQLKRIPNLAEAFKKGIEIAIFDVGNRIAGEAKTKAPKKTGNLMRSIKLGKPKGIKKGSNIKAVGSSLDYARIHDLGGRGVKAKYYLTEPFMRLWKNEGKTQIKKRIDIELKKIKT